MLRRLLTDLGRLARNVRLAADLADSRAEVDEVRRRRRDVEDVLVAARQEVLSLYAQLAAAQTDRAALQVAIAEQRLAPPLVFTPAVPIVAGRYLYSDRHGIGCAEVFCNDAVWYAYVPGEREPRKVATMVQFGCQWAGPLVAVEPTP